MPKAFKLQDPGEGIHEAEILEVHVSEGDEVEEGDTVLVIETDKAAIEVPAPFTGVIEGVRVAVGDVAEVGDVLMTYSTNGEAEPDQEEQEAPEKEDRKTAEEDVAETRDAATAAAATEQPSEAREAPESGRPVPAAPSTRRLARELEVDLHDVAPSGPGGRVTADDVRAFAESGEAETGAEKAAREEPETVSAGQEAPEEEHGEDKAEEAPRDRRSPAQQRVVPVAVEAPALPDFSRWGEVERVPLRSIRRATARKMALSWSQIPHVTHMDVADITDLEGFRQEHKEQVAAEGGDLTLTVLVMKAVVAALKDFPRFNAGLDPDAEAIILKKYYHLGIAVDTDKGLLVPVVRDVDRKSIAELAVELTEVAERTRRGEATREEMQGGTFTITNPGPLGGTALTPIINYPQVAILGLARAAWQPVVQGDPPEDVEVVPRFRLPLCLAFDHRVNDGADAARFVSRIIDLLGDPESLVLTV